MGASAREGVASVLPSRGQRPRIASARYPDVGGAPAGRHSVGFVWYPGAGVVAADRSVRYPAAGDVLAGRLEAGQPRANLQGRIHGVPAMDRLQPPGTALLSRVRGGASCSNWVADFSPCLPAARCSGRILRRRTRIEAIPATLGNIAKRISARLHHI